jgi:hypothetical protein
MKKSLGLLAVLMLAATAWTGFGEELVRRTPMGSSVRIDLGDGELQIGYIEADEGMMLLAEVEGSSVRARRLFIGNGKQAVAFESTNDGFLTPNGIKNAAGITLPRDSVLEVPKSKLEPWGARAGEVYLLTERIKLVARPE